MLALEVFHILRMLELLSKVNHVHQDQKFETAIFENSDLKVSKSHHLFKIISINLQEGVSAQCFANCSK